MIEQRVEKLENSPLIEAIFELRFKPRSEAVGDLLPGLLYESLKGSYPNVVTLPASGVPREMRNQDPNLFYQPLHRLFGKDGSVQVGDRMVSLSIMNYSGWIVYKDKIETLIKNLKSTNLLLHIQRFSLRYINIIETQEDEDPFKSLDATFEVLGKKPPKKGFYLRIENNEEEFTTIIQINTDVTATRPESQPRKGLLIDLDTVQSASVEDLDSLSGSFLEEGHAILKRTFFSLLSEEALKRLKPISR